MPVPDETIQTTRWKQDSRSKRVWDSMLLECSEAYLNELGGNSGQAAEGTMAKQSFEDGSAKGTALETRDQF